MSRRLQQKPIAMTEEMIEAIDKYAAKHNTNFSNAVRLLIDSSLDTDAARANENMIRQYIREELDICIAPYLKKIEGIIEHRVIPICARTGRTSAISFATVIGMLTENYTDGRSHENILTTAKKFAAQYLKEKVKPEEEYRQGAREELNPAYNASNFDDEV